MTVTCGNGIGKSPATTVEFLDKLATTAVTADNWKLLAAELEYLDLPQKQEIVNDWRERFAPPASTEPAEEVLASDGGTADLAVPMGR